MGKSLRELRNEAFLSQIELAKEAGLTIATISRLETGKRKPHRRTVRKIAKVLKVQPGDIDFSL